MLTIPILKQSDDLAISINSDITEITDNSLLPE
jgi:hypothetical protein